MLNVYDVLKGRGTETPSLIFHGFLVLVLLASALVLFYLRLPNWLIWPIAVGLLLLSRIRYLLIFTAFSAVLIALYGPASSFLVHVGDAASYLLDGLSFYTGTYDADYFFPPMASVVSWLSIAVGGLEFATIGFQLIAAFTALIALSTFKNITNCDGAAFLMFAILLLSPLFIWYSKSSYSEPLYLFLYVFSVWLILSGGEKGVSVPCSYNWLLVSCALLVSILAPQTRGTGFILGALLASILAYQRSLGNYLWPYVAIAALSAGSLLFLLYTRYTYVWEWQLSQMLPGFPLWASISTIFAGVCVAPVFGWSLASRLRMKKIVMAVASAGYGVYLLVEFVSLISAPCE